MTQQQNTLLGFLQKQSIFHSSPSPNWRNRSRSHRSRDLEGSRDKGYLTKQSRFNGSRQASPAEINNHQRDITSSAKYYKEQHRNGLLQDRWGSPNRQMHGSLEKVGSGRKQGYQQQRQQRVVVSSQTPIKVKEGFQTAHIESFQCLENISKKLWVRIIEINHKLDNFSRMVKQWISEELIHAQKSILNIVEAAFKEQESFILAYVAKQQKQISSHLGKTKGLLEAQYKRIDELEEHLKGPQWRKAAGQILSSELQKKIQSFIQQTAKTDLFQWKPKSYVRDHLKLIQLQVKEIFKLKTYP